MRTRSLLTALACTAVLTGATGETAFADSNAPVQPSSAPSVPSTAPPKPVALPSSAPSTTRPSAGASPSAAPTTDARGVSIPPLPVASVPATGQISAVPSGAPNTGVAPVGHDGHGEAAAIGVGLAALLGGSGTLALRRRKAKGQG